MLISVHLPKTAGGSFGQALSARFGDRLRHDYADQPLNTPVHRRVASAEQMRVANIADDHDGIECIHGHFLPYKYLSCGTARFVTWLRDPVERMASHYHYWRLYQPGDLAPLHARVLNEDWSLERFCLGPELKNVYAQFLWRFPLERFDFVGITEHYESDLASFSRMLPGAPLALYRKNENPQRGGENHVTDPGLRRAIERHHSDDLALYRLALAMRRTRCREGAG